MQSISTRVGGEQSRAPDFERINSHDQLSSNELQLISNSWRDEREGVGLVVNASVWPAFRLDGRHVRGVFRCQQCEQAHIVGLSDDYIRCAPCRGAVAPGSERIDGVRLLWRYPADMPEDLRDEVERPEIGWCPGMAADAVRSIARCVRDSARRDVSKPERRRLVVILRGYLRSRVFEAALAERLDGEETRRERAALRRELCRAVYTRHAGPGRPSTARLIETAARALDHQFYFGSLW